MILMDAQKLAKNMQLDDFNFDANYLPENSTIPAIEFRLQVPMLPGQDTSHFNKLEYQVSNNCRVACLAGNVGDVSKCRQFWLNMCVVSDIKENPTHYVCTFLCRGTWYRRVLR
jgi:hypothetical protein